MKCNKIWNQKGQYSFAIYTRKYRVYWDCTINVSTNNYKTKIIVISKEQFSKVFKYLNECKHLKHIYSRNETSTNVRLRLCDFLNEFFRIRQKNMLFFMYIEWAMEWRMEKTGRLNWKCDNDESANILKSTE